MTHRIAALARTAPAVEVAPSDPRSVRMQLDATSQAVLTADEAYLRPALDSTSSSRRGLLQRLTRT